MANKRPKQSNESSSKKRTKKFNIATPGKTQSTPGGVGGKSNYRLEINPAQDPSLMKEHARTNNYRAFYKLLPENLRPVSDVLFNFYRAEHILRARLIESPALVKNQYSKLVESTKQRLIEAYNTGKVTHKAANQIEGFGEWMEDYGAGFEGTKKLVKKYKKDTPGEEVKEAVRSRSSVGDREVETADFKRIKIMTPKGARWRRVRTKQNILRSSTKGRVNESVVLTEEDTQKVKKVLFLAQQGLVSSAELTKYRVIIKKFLQNKSLTAQEREYLNKKYDEILGMITSDSQLYNRFRAIL